jgi:hypothetical protein
MANWYTEAGVEYTRCLEEIADWRNPVGYVFQYRWNFIPSGGSGEAKRVLVLGGRKDAERLIEYWSRTPEWKYELLN